MSGRSEIRDIAAAAVARVRPRRGKRIIVLHEVKQPGALREKLAWLAESCDIATLSTLLDGDRGDKAQVALTFDDGYRSWIDDAAPLLEEFSIPAVFFVCSGFIGLSGPATEAFCRQRLRRKAILEPMDAGQLRELAGHPLFEIGSHTVNHPDLGTITDPAVLEAEIGADRRRIEDWTGAPVRWFAFPFGQPENTSPATRTYLEAHGFGAAFTLVPSFAGGADRYAVGRDSLDMTAPEWVWRGRLAGGYDGLYRLKRRLQRNS